MATATAAAVEAEVTEPTALDIKKQDRVRDLRRRFSRRPDAFPETKIIIDDEGNLNKDYFSRVHLAHKRWTRQDGAKLIEGLREYSLHFADIKEKLLPDWQEKELKVRTMRLLGVRDLGFYRGFAFRNVPEEFFREQYEKNYEDAMAESKWEFGMYDNRIPM